MDPITISVTSSADRLTQREQIMEVLQRAKEKGEPVRIRLPFSLYDYDTTRTYIPIRDAAWNLQLPTAQTTPEMIEQLIVTIGKCLVAIAQEGSEKVIEKLERAL